jgi:hypothetical protein
VEVSQSPEFIHEEIHARPGGPDHFRQRVLVHELDYRGIIVSFFIVIQQQKHACQSFFARIKQMID